MALVTNKKWSQEYSLVEKKVFGLELLGAEVKSLKSSQGSLDGGRVLERNGEVSIVGAYIPVYQEKNNPNLDPYRTRKVLCTRKEILEIRSLGVGNNLQIFPIGIFLQGRKLKLECGIGTRLNKKDKREKIKKEDLKRRGL